MSAAHFTKTSYVAWTGQPRLHKEIRMPAPLLGKALKEKMIKGQAVFGTFLQHATNPAIVDVIPEGALDFVIVTAEHNALDLAEFLPVRYALAAKGIACLARTHSREPDDVSKVCDSYDGVVVPYVEEVDHAKRLAAAAVYRPLKGKALDAVLAEGKWPSDKTRRYIAEERCANTVFVPMIESLRGIENLEAICDIPGVNAVFVGPNDLTTTMGIPNEYDHPDLVAVLKKIIDTAEARHVAAGCWFGKRDQMLRTIRQGARFNVFSNDGSLLREALDQSFKTLRQG
jgi:2-keto-3-deoxy-L-rhamnonate aldolase RhmA